MNYPFTNDFQNVTTKLHIKVAIIQLVNVHVIAQKKGFQKEEWKLELVK